MGIEKERKSTFLTAFEQREKEARSLFVSHKNMSEYDLLLEELL